MGDGMGANGMGANGIGALAGHGIVVWLIVGAIAGWLAGKVVRGGGFGLLGDIAVGIVGSLIAGYLLPRLHVSLGIGFFRAVIDAFIGAVILLVVLRLFTGVGKRY